MGLSRVRQIVDGLMQAGRSRQTPAAVISHATTEAQEICEGTLENLADRVEEAQLTSPALIIVGDVVALRRQLHFLKRSRCGGNIIWLQNWSKTFTSGRHAPGKGGIYQ